MSAIIAGFRKYGSDIGYSDRSDAECTFELLMIGVMLREHGGEAERWPKWVVWTLKQVQQLSDHWAKLEPVCKRVRGIIGGLARTVAGGNGHGGMDLERLLAWMRANNQGVRADRVAEWRDFLIPAVSATNHQALVAVRALADDFDRNSKCALASYTQCVEMFRIAAAQTYRSRYDAELVMRTPLEYHLGMVGTEILNRVYRERFASTRRRVVILPPCMRAHSDKECLALQTDLGAMCRGCTPGCHVHQVTLVGQRCGFEVYMIPDDLHRIGAASAGSAGGLGLVGVSCALTNWSGGWEAEQLGVPAQGVLLDYVGCSYHWDDVGIATNANLRQIKSIAVTT